MLKTEYIRSLHCNYERILLDKKPEDKKYQYCILSRGGIKGLLPFSLRYLNGLAYLYYDISSKQNICQLYEDRCITREWLKDLLWGVQQIRMELGRFLLSEQNLLFYPEQIYQDLEKNIFSFLYIPYYEGEDSFLHLVEFLVERIDYEDEALVECVYHMHEQYERNGATYLQARVFEDAKYYLQEEPPKEVVEKSVVEETISSAPPLVEQTEKVEKKGLRALWETRKKKEKLEREQYLQKMEQEMLGLSVAESVEYDRELGNTIYIEENKSESKQIHRLCTPDGELLVLVDLPIITIGKKRGEVTVCFDDLSVSRLHARVLQEGGDVYLEDMNSTNGTFKNGLRLNPYERRKLEEGDEIQIGRKMLIYR